MISGDMEVEGCKGTLNVVIVSTVAPCASDNWLTIGHLEVGGSLSGLMHGVMLKRLGHNVRILEKQVGSPKSQMAGVSMGSLVQDFLAKYDKIDQPFGLRSECFQSIDYQGRIKKFFVTPRASSSWDALYFRLRANFDGLRSDYYPEPTSSGPHDGKVTYDSGMQVKDLRPSGDRVMVEIENSESGKVQQAHPDLVLAADGSISSVRQKFLQRSANQRSDPGYVVWRGVVPEMDVSGSTRRCFQENLTYTFLPGGHAIVSVFSDMKPRVR